MSVLELRTQPIIILEIESPTYEAKDQFFPNKNEFTV